MSSPEQTEITLSSHRTFYSIAYRHYCEVKQLVSERDRRAVKDDEDVDYVCEKNASIQRSAMVCVVFCALALEAFINHYGIEKLSRTFFDNHLDSLNPVSKWLLLPRLIVGQQIKTSGEPFMLLTELFRLRNKLVHYKTRKKRICDLTQEDWVTEKQARDAIEAVNSLAEALRSIDPTVDTSWLKDAGTDPYA